MLASSLTSGQTVITAQGKKFAKNPFSQRLQQESTATLSKILTQWHQKNVQTAYWKQNKPTKKMITVLICWSQWSQNCVITI